MRYLWRDLSIAAKNLVIVFVSICIVFVTSLSALQYVAQVSREELHASQRTDLFRTSTQLSENLKEIEGMTRALLINEGVQRNLQILKNSNKYPRAEIAAAKSALVLALQETQYLYTPLGVYCISLFTEKETLTSNSNRASEVPLTVQQKVLEYSRAKNGSLYISTDYMQSYGLLVSRSVRSTSPSTKFERLGDIFATVDFEKMLISIDNNTSANEYLNLIVQNNTILYSSPELAECGFTPPTELMPGENCVLQCNNGTYYFATCVDVPDSSWRYIRLKPYSNVIGSLQTAVRFCFLALFCAAVVSIILSRVMTQSIAKHLHTLIIKIKAFSTDETFVPYVDYDYRKRQDELGILHRNFDNMVAQIQKLIQENYIKDTLNTKAELKALRNQINPHFLYNTLSSIQWRAKNCHATDISEMVESLSVLLRGVLNEESSSYTIAQEAELVKSYIAIQQHRYEERLCFVMDIDPEALSVHVPKLIIQPLVENAIRYGLEESAESCHINVSICKLEKHLKIQVKNDCSVFEENLMERLNSNTITPQGFGIGLLNIQRRLQLTYPQSTLRIYNIEDMWAVVEIAIPQTQGGKALC